jgi:flagellar hook assembly protein FlgD
VGGHRLGFEGGQRQGHHSRRGWQDRYARCDLGEQDGGLVRFVWDGKNTAGELQSNGLQLQGDRDRGGNRRDATTYSLGSVVSVASTDSDAMEAEVSGVGTLTLDKIRQVY